MKRPYTIYTTRLRRVMKARGLDLDGAYELFRSAAHQDNKDNHHVRSLWLVANRVEWLVLSGYATHIFVTDKNFCDWLVKCVPVAKPEHGEVIQAWLGEDNAGVLHFPCCSGLSSMAFQFADKPENLDGTLADKYSGLFVTLPPNNNSNKHCFSVSLHTQPNPGDTSWHWYYIRLIAGLSLYVDCFPEAVKVGVPDELKHPSHHQYKQALTISVSPKVASAAGTHASPCGHFRSGHFRVLRSEKFKKKRFQTIFIHQTFVNGKAKTVLSPEELTNA